MDTNVTIPAGLLVAGGAVILVFSTIAPGPGGILPTLLGMAFIVAISVAVSLVALLIASALAGISYGEIGPVILKLSAITLAPTAASMLVPWLALAWIVLILSYLGLVKWLFDLDGWEFIITIAVLIVTRTVAAALAATVVAAFTAAT